MSLKRGLLAIGVFACSCALAQDDKEPSAERKTNRASFTVDLTPRPNTVTSFDIAVKTRTQLRFEVSPTLSDADRKTYNLKSSSMEMGASFTERQRVQAGKADDSGMPIEATLDILNWKAVEGDRSSTEPVLPNYRFTGHFNAETGYDFSKIVLILKGIETVKDVALPALEFGNTFGLWGAFGARRMDIGTTVYMPFPSWQLPLMLSQRTHVVAWTLVGIKGTVAEFKGALVEWERVAREYSKKPPLPPQQGEELSSSGRLLIDMHQRRPIKLELDIRSHLWRTDPLGSTEDTVHTIEWRGGR